MLELGIFIIGSIILIIIVILLLYKSKVFSTYSLDNVEKLNEDEIDNWFDDYQSLIKKNKNLIPILLIEDNKMASELISKQFKIEPSEGHIIIVQCIFNRKTAQIKGNKVRVIRAKEISKEIKEMFNKDDMIVWKYEEE